MTEPDWNWGDDQNSKSPNPYNRATPTQQPQYAQQHAPNNYYTAHQQSQNTNVYPQLYGQQNSFAAASATDQWGDQGQWNSGIPTGGPPPHAYSYGADIPLQQPGNPAYSTMFPQHIMSDPLLNTARQIGGQFAEQQREKISKYLSSFHLKYYFAVDSNYVAKKIGIILFPFFHRDWTTKLSQGGEPVTARQDANAPDLYIPLMSFLTYVLVSGFVLGLQKRFSPEKLGMLTTNALFYLFLENGIVFITKYVLNISQSLNIWHALSYSSYKFVGMVFCLLLYLLGGTTVYYCALAYCIFATVFFLLRSLKTIILDMGGYGGADGGRKRKLYLLLSITLLQSLIMWLLTRSVTSYMPDNYDFAKMAMSGIGLAKINSQGMPMQPDGEVDYEALLKMP